MAKLTARVERYETALPFVIARGPKLGVEVIVAEAREGEVTGVGEGTPIYYRGEMSGSVAEAIAELGEIGSRAELQQRLGPGAARNAVDCALWSLEARQKGVAVWQLAGLAGLEPVITAYTISLGDPAAIEAAARSAAGRPCLKIKLGGDGGDRDRVAAVQRAAPGAKLIADANEAWMTLDIAAEAAALAALGVSLIEQPVPAGREDLLDGVDSPVPLCADESLHTRADLDRCAGRFQAINIKLDKAGGLTEALALKAEAETRGMKVMIGCMLSTSLAIAPALIAAQGAGWADLDGPLLLAADRAGGLTFSDDGRVHPGSAALWG
ncbi:MAG: dipeptide epimerase [Sphingomonadaceae bacterium]|nr:dipeptide epimerase [Sphingomonadaceae bacterium]